MQKESIGIEHIILADPCRQIGKCQRRDRFRLNIQEKREAIAKLREVNLGFRYKCRIDIYANR